MAIIEVQNVTKTYRPRRRASKLLMGRDGLFRFLRRSEPETFDAVHDVSFTVEPGESLGLIGPNGSGKSTVMKILAGVTTPTNGDVTVQGRVASLLELGAGFHPFLTGRENVYLNAGLLGMRHKQTDKVFDDIVAFSGIGEFIDHPVDTYSSGMYVRIAFSVAVHVNPDVFLVDEVLAVGDEEFQRRCRTRIGELKEQGKTIVFVSHDLGIVNTLCDRVILLNKGKMIVRDTPQRTIDFYLRQVGQEKGIHTFAGDTVDGIFSNGRMALFHDQNEVTAATGITGSASSLGSQHHSSAADWRIVEESETGCLARGEFGRLPVIFWWRIALEEKTLTWTIEIECEREVPIDEFHFQVHLPTSYTQWLYGDLSGEFPDLTPADIAWSVIAAPERTSYEAVGLPAEGAPLPAFFVRMRDADPKFRLAWSNTDYVTGSRALSLICRYPQAARTQPAGRRALATLEIDLGQDTASARQLVQLDRTLSSGDLSARFEQGAIRLAAGGEELTTSLHLYASMLLRHIWHDSTSLQWGPVTIEDGVLRVSGESRRFPLKHHWEVRAEPGGFALQIVLETTQPLEIQEYQTSILLRPEYEEWTTGHESGTFPPIPEDENTWRHVNQDYAPGATLGASGPGVPTVTVELAPEGPTTRATALNTGFFQNARVLQALCVPESGLLYYDLGRHVYFSGHIRIDRGPAQEG